MLDFGWPAPSTTDILAAYAAIVSTVALAFEAVRCRREGLRLKLHATTSAYYKGDFALDMEPELSWRIRAVVINNGGVPVVVGRTELVLFSSTLMRWFRSPLDSLESHSGSNIELDAGNVAEFDLNFSNEDYIKWSSGGNLWLALHHSRSSRSLVVRLPQRLLAEADLKLMWRSYDGDYSDEQEQVLERIARKQQAQEETRK